MFAAPLLCELTVPAPVAVALQQTWAAVRAQLPPVQRAPFRPAGEMAHVVDNVTHLRLLPIVRLGTTERLYLRGADLAIVNSGACALLVQAERLECLRKHFCDTASPARLPVSPSPA